jgi:hypothetical protein
MTYKISIFCNDALNKTYFCVSEFSINTVVGSMRPMDSGLIEEEEEGKSYKIFNSCDKKW